MPFIFSKDEPEVSSWRLLEQHLSVTPESFVDSPPVLHAHYSGCRAVIDRTLLDLHQGLKSWFESGLIRDTGMNGTGAVQHTEAPEQDVKQDIEIWITTEALVLFAANNSENTVKTVKIPYPAISLHATKRVYVETASGSKTAQCRYHDQANSSTRGPFSALYLQLDPFVDERDSSNPNVEDIDGILELLIVPPPHHGSTDGGNGTNGTPSIMSGESELPTNQDSVNEAFSALNACADLWPGPIGDDEDDGGEGSGLPGFGGMGGSGLPGESGWITSENMSQFQDVFANVEEDVGEDGSVRILGPGAGTRRAREEEEDGNSENEANSEAHDVDGGSEETKWQRTD